MEDEAETTGDAVYKWTVRSLYLVAIVLNLVVVWDGMKSTDEGRRVQHTMNQWKQKLTEPARLRRQFRKEANRVVLDAMLIVDAEKVDEDGE